MYAIYFAFSYACSAKRLNWQHRQTDLIGEGSLSLMQMHYAEIRFVEYHVRIADCAQSWALEWMWRGLQKMQRVTHIFLGVIHPNCIMSTIGN